MQNTVKPMLNGHSQKDKYGFQDRLSLNAGQKYEHSAIPELSLGF